MFGNATAQTKTIVKASEVVGVKLPASVLDAYRRHSEALQTLHTLYPKGGLAPAVAAALAAGRDPATDPEVQRADLAMRIGSHEITGLVENILTEEMREAFATHADVIVKAWVKPFDQAAEALSGAYSVLGDVDLTDTAAVLNLGEGAAVAWSQVQAGVVTIDTIVGAWMQLADFARLVNHNPRYPALRLVTVTAETWRAQELDRKRLTPWEAVTQGLPLSLPTMAEYRNRVRDIERRLAELAAAEMPIDREREATRAWSNKVAAASRAA